MINQWVIQAVTVNLGGGLISGDQ